MINKWYIIVPAIALLLGIGAGYLIFNCKVGPNPTIEYLEEDLARTNKRYDSIVSLNRKKDSIAAIEIIKRDSIVRDIKKETNEVIKKGVDRSNYDKLIESNRTRGVKRFAE